MIPRRKPLARGKPPKRPGKPLRRRSRPKARGGSLFPKRREPRYWKWCGEQVKCGVPCDNCGLYPANSRAHLIPRSLGGDDLWNIAFLCSGPGSCFCHERSEKRADAFVREDDNSDLYAIARAHTARYLAERAP